jgi:hypothetical protein
MKWSVRSALPSIPSDAVVELAAVDAVEHMFSHCSDLERSIADAFSRFDDEQPALGAFLASEFDSLRDDTAQALGYFLSVCVYEAFRRAFGKRLGVADASTVELAKASLELDERMRREDSTEPFESDDIVAMQQPHVMAFVREQIDSVLAPDDEQDVARDVDVDDVSAVYRAMLVCILALSQVVRPSRGDHCSRRMLS